MLPVLLNLKLIEIYTFGVFLVLSFFWGAFLLWSNIRLSSYKEEEIFDGVFLSMAGALFFGRLMYVILHFEKFGFSFLKFILINGYPGISLIGSVVGGILVFHLYTLFHKISFFEASDYFTSPLLLSIGIGKLGSFFSGVEVGVKTKFPLAIKYAGYEGLRHPFALYESILFFVGAYIAYKLMFSIRRGTLQKGGSIFFFWWFFAIILLSFSKLSVPQSTIVKYDFNMVVSLVILLTSTLYFIYYFRSQFLKVRFPKMKKKKSKEK